MKILGKFISFLGSCWVERKRD